MMSDPPETKVYEFGSMLMYHRVVGKVLVSCRNDGCTGTDLGDFSVDEAVVVMADDGVGCCCYCRWC